MERLQLKAQVREGRGKGAARQLRMQGMIPGILYGRGETPVALTVNLRELDRALHGSGDTNQLFDLEIEGQSVIPAMVRDYQAHVISRRLTHVDFLKVDLTKKIHVEVPLHLVGKAAGVKEGGILEHLRRTVEVVCLPISIPEAIDVDISGLNIGDILHLSDVALPANVEWITATDVSVAAVVAPAEEKVEAAAATTAEPEVIGKKKPAEEAAPAGDNKKK